MSAAAGNFRPAGLGLRSQNVSSRTYMATCCQHVAGKIHSELCAGANSVLSHDRIENWNPSALIFKPDIMEWFARVFAIRGTLFMFTWGSVIMIGLWGRLTCRANKLKSGCLN